LGKPVIRATKSFFRVTFNGPGDNILDLTPDVPEEDSVDLSHLNERQLEALKLVVNEGKTLTNESYRRRFNVPRRTAARDLVRLAETGLIIRKGVGKGTYYTASQTNGT